MLRGITELDIIRHNMFDLNQFHSQYLLISKVIFIVKFTFSIKESSNSVILAKETKNSLLVLGNTGNPTISKFHEKVLTFLMVHQLLCTCGDAMTYPPRQFDPC
ncbi:hypothetical protein GOODEAATRI_013992 [Goodea atripinnis]|uniref:Uncharacterized protein n=1 Tax=Goodea atripinnis TaxID=208336 RepID=A0ABV0NUF7_9TELE